MTFFSSARAGKKDGEHERFAGDDSGNGKAMKDVNIDDNSFKPVEAIIRAMTLEERENPDVINGSRKNRIATGSGTSIQQVNQLLKQFSRHA